MADVVLVLVVILLGKEIKRDCEVETKATQRERERMCKGWGVYIITCVVEVCVCARTSHAQHLCVCFEISGASLSFHHT